MKLIIPKVTGGPTFEDLKVIWRLLNTNAIIVSSYLGGGSRGHVKLLPLPLPLPQPPLWARTDARTNPSAKRATQLRSVLARLRCRKTEPHY
jgi:hypothetical protein